MSTDGSLPPRLYSLVGQRVRKRRQDLATTQAELAQRIGVTRTSVTNLERGRQQMPLHQLLAIAHVLDVELADLLPTRAELGLTGAPVEVDGQKAPKTAKLISDLQSGDGK